MLRTWAAASQLSEVPPLPLWQEFYLVDMPGYGFALAGERDVARWQALCQHYLQKRKMLKLVVVLVDGRTGLKRSDLQARVLGWGWGWGWD